MPFKNPVHVNPSIEELWEGPAILSGTTREYDATFAGPASIKTVVSGKALLAVEGREMELRPGVLIVLGRNVPYRLIVDSFVPVRTLSLFSPELVTAQSPFYVTAEKELTQELVMEMDMGQEELLDRFICLSGFVEQQMVDSHCRLTQVASRVQTRREIIAILSRTRNYVLSNASKREGLNEIAYEAGLSPFHLHRLYRKYFGVTPYEDQIRFTCSEAENLLLSGMPAGEVALRMGFESHSAFSRAYRRTMGVAPSNVARSV